MSQRSRVAQQCPICILADERFPTNDPTSVLSTSWSFDLMEQVFARRPELEIYAWRIQGAA